MLALLDVVREAEAGVDSQGPFSCIGVVGCEPEEVCDTALSENLRSFACADERWTSVIQEGRLCATGAAEALLMDCNDIDMDAGICCSSSDESTASEFGVDVRNEAMPFLSSKADVPKVARPMAP
jgi:hypothetical protein